VCASLWKMVVIEANVSNTVGSNERNAICLIMIKRYHTKLKQYDLSRDASVYASVEREVLHHHH
jgi:hypothetical protein